MARARRWYSLAVVTSKYHVVRAGMWFRRCYGGKVNMLGTEPGSFRRIWVEQVPHEWAALAQLVVRRGC